MKRTVALVVILVLVPATAASADLDDLLERSREASYSAEQIVTCSTPEGVRDAVVRIQQSGGEVRLGSTASTDVEVSTGLGSWALKRQGGVVSAAAVEPSSQPTSPKYVLSEPRSSEVLGRPASSYALVQSTGSESDPGSDVLRAELVFDNQTGALMAAITFLEDGSTYCRRRFVSFDPTDPDFPPFEISDFGEPQASVEIETDLPDEVAGFDRLDLYEDADGFRFAYYSDGFFSFAVFETPIKVELPGGSRIVFGEAAYQRSFTAGHATYVWESRDGGVALVGDLPPDLHESVLAGLPDSEEPGLLKRWWRRLFG
jgi:hypothetical protein